MPNPMRLVGGVLLFALGLSEMLTPGWNGFFVEPSDISADAQRIVMAIYTASGVILFFGGRWK